MSRVIALVVLALTATACKDEKLERLAAIRDDVCACKSSSCARASLAAAQREATPSTPKTQQLGREMLACLADLLEVEAETMAGSDAPPAELGSGSTGSGPGSGSAR